MPNTRDKSVDTVNEGSRRKLVAETPRQVVALEGMALQNAIMNSVDLAIIATDAKGIIRLFNYGAERLLGYAASDVIDKMEPSDFHDPQAAIARAEQLSEEFASTITPGFGALAYKASRGIEDKYELPLIRKDGSRLPGEISITALRNDKTEIIGYLIIGTDNSLAKLAADAAKREKVAQEMFRRAVEASPSGMLMVDREGEMVMVNAEVERQFGYRREELIGHSVDMLLPVRLRSPHARSREAYNLRPETRPVEARSDLLGLRKDGTEFSVGVSLNPFQVDGSLLVLGVVVDLTEHNRINRMKDEFVATVSHELRTPLTSIVATLGILTSKAAAQVADQAPRMLTIAYTNSQRLVRLLNDILDIEKMESGKAAFNFKRVELLPLVEQTIEENRAFAEGYKVRIRLETTSAATTVRADPDRLTQVVTNLLSNAIKFSPPGEEVVVAVETKSETVGISVRDHGRGISDEFKPRVFKKFAQADATDARQKDGTGLGLSIVKQIVDRLDGAVGFEDAPGGGTIFHVELPNWAHAVRTQSRLPAMSDHRVLLCEDDPEAAIVICDRLLQGGFITDIALTADEAVAHVAAASYFAILVDLQLPEGDGISLIKKLRAQPQVYNTLLVVLSANLDPVPEDEQPSALLNVLDWLDAPIDVDRLMRVLDRPIVRNRSLRPRILYVDSDASALRAVAKALDAKAEVMSVGSIDEARRALTAKRFDVAVLDVALALGSGLELLHELRDNEGDAIPLIVFSAPDASPAFSGQFRAALIKSRTSIDKIVATLRNRLVSAPASPKHKDAA